MVMTSAPAPLEWRQGGGLAWCWGSPLGVLSWPWPPCSLTAPSAPGSIRFSELTTTSVNVSWEPPPLPNGVLEGYRLVYEPCMPVDGEGMARGAGGRLGALAGAGRALGKTQLSLHPRRCQ